MIVDSSTLHSFRCRINTATTIRCANNHVVNPVHTDKTGSAKLSIGDLSCPWFTRGFRFSMRFPRASGILLHPTCLPGTSGIGDFGPAAFAFIDFLKDAGQKRWQVLPLNPTGYGDSPFQCFSAHAGNHLLISLERLVGQGVLENYDLLNQPDFPKDSVDFEGVIRWKTGLLTK